MLQSIDPLHAMQFRPAPDSQSGFGVERNGLLRVTVAVREIPLVTAAYGTRVARPAKGLHRTWRRRLRLDC